MQQLHKELYQGYTEFEEVEEMLDYARIREIEETVCNLL